MDKCLKPPFAKPPFRLSRPRPQKISKKVSGTVRDLECSGTFWRLFGVLGPEGPGDVFETLSAFRARRARFPNVGRDGSIIARAMPQCGELSCNYGGIWVVEGVFIQGVLKVTDLR